MKISSDLEGQYVFLGFHFALLVSVALAVFALLLIAVIIVAIVIVIVEAAAI